MVGLLESSWLHITYLISLTLYFLVKKENTAVSEVLNIWILFYFLFKCPVAFAISALVYMNKDWNETAREIGNNHSSNWQRVTEKLPEKFCDYETLFGDDFDDESFSSTCGEQNFGQLIDKLNRDFYSS